MTVPAAGGEPDSAPARGPLVLLALILVAAGNLSYEEVAEICGIALGTVKSRVCRARAMLCQIIESGQLPDFRHNFVLSGGAIDAFFGELARIANTDTLQVAAA